MKPFLQYLSRPANALGLLFLLVLVGACLNIEGGQGMATFFAIIICIYLVGSWIRVKKRKQ